MVIPQRLAGGRLGLYDVSAVPALHNVLGGTRPLYDAVVVSFISARFQARVVLYACRFPLDLPPGAGRSGPSHGMAWGWVWHGTV